MALKADANARTAALCATTVWGSEQPPMSVGELRAQMMLRMRAGTEENGTGGVDPLEAMRPDPDTD